MLERFQVSGCCLFLPLRTGCIAIALCGLFLDAVYITYIVEVDLPIVQALVKDGNFSSLGMFATDMTVYSIDVIIDILLLFAVLKSHAILMLSWIVVQFFLWIWIFCILIVDLVQGSDGFLVFFDTANLFLYPYYVLVVFSYYRTLKNPSIVERLDYNNHEEEPKRWSDGSWNSDLNETSDITRADIV